LASVEESRKERRGQILELLGGWNQKRCDSAPIYGEDLRESVSRICGESFTDVNSVPITSIGSYYCAEALQNPSMSLSFAIKTIQQRTENFRSLLNNFVIYVPAVCAPAPSLHISHPHPSRYNEERETDKEIQLTLKSTLRMLHPIISAMSTQFPDPRLIQYDCGKLQTLDRLLKQLKSGGHRVIKNYYHGHIYLRLDGTTKVEQRQLLMERFNGDKRMFVFILSTRSGGVGINLTGADTVIFYDSDWNPTMDAQAQDRCHRIGQTRYVHIYRLVSEKTIEENILKKANQKRMLGDLAIEGGNFTTAYFKSTTIQDLFAVDNVEEDASARLAEVIEREKERKERLQQSLAVASTSASNNSAAGSASSAPLEETKSAINVFESALAAAEDDQDVQAAKFAKAEASADLEEFDENIPIDQELREREPEMSKAEKEVQNLISQLSPIERYAMRFVEDTEGTWTAIRLKAVEAEIEQQKRGWEANRLAQQKREEEAARQQEAEENDLLTFSREDAQNQVNKSSSKFNSSFTGGKLNNNNVSREGKKIIQRRVALVKNSHKGLLGKRKESVKEVNERGNCRARSKSVPPSMASKKARRLAISKQSEQSSNSVLRKRRESAHNNNVKSVDAPKKRLKKSPGKRNASYNEHKDRRTGDSESLKNDETVKEAKCSEEFDVNVAWM
ncbi:helicase domino-like, partial [Topomyia yanbarensis]|uniref:helicase domino-like n=1 Tax=Topomyia yanbarensis TaxID=2498891 RepID=UPI00273AE1EE